MLTELEQFITDSLIFVNIYNIISEMNTIATQLFGCLIGQNISSIIPDWERIPIDEWIDISVKLPTDTTSIATCKIVNSEKTKIICLKIAIEDSNYDQIRNRHQFIAFLSHELRNSLQSITMACRMLRHVNKEANPRINRYQCIIDNCCRDMRKILNDVLDLHKIDAGELSIEDEVIELKQLIEELNTNFVPLAEEKGITLQINICPESPTEFNSDQVRVNQIVSNLLSNAIKYSKEGSFWGKMK